MSKEQLKQKYFETVKIWDLFGLTGRIKINAAKKAALNAGIDPKELELNLAFNYKANNEIKTL